MAQSTSNHMHIQSATDQTDLKAPNPQLGLKQLARLERALRLGNGWHVVFYDTESQRSEVEKNILEMGFEINVVSIPAPFNANIRDFLKTTAHRSEEPEVLLIKGEFRSYEANSPEVKVWFDATNQIESHSDPHLGRIVWLLSSEHRHHFNNCPDWNSRITLILTIANNTVEE